MRQLPSLYLNPKPSIAKKVRAQVEHVSAPLKGLSLSSKLTIGDPLTAIRLDNWVIEENQIKVRAGTNMQWSYATRLPVWCLVPWYGTPNRFAAAIDGKLMFTDNTALATGFTSNDWHWTAFSNLAQVDYTVMVNGQDGVWSWDGAVTTTPPVDVTSLTSATAAVCTVAPADISKFSNGMVVEVTGAAGSGTVNANGFWTLSSVNVPPNTFILTGCNTTGGVTQTTGVKVNPPGGMVKENVTAPAGATHINVAHFNIVLAHMNRLWFADNTNQSVYYLPLQQKSGQVKELPLQALFKRGGDIRALATWSRDGGVGMDDCLCIFSTNGECAIYAGVDPDSEFHLIGVFRFDAPMSKFSVINYGGDLYVLISTGLVPMSTLLQAETEQLGQADRNIFSEFFPSALQYRDRPGWQVIHNPSSGRMICNIPQGAPNSYKQAVRFMPNPIWATWSALPSRCWLWMNARMYMGSDDGRVYEIHPNYLNDASPVGPLPIRVDLQMAWSNYKTAGIKHFKMLLSYITTNGNPKPFLDIRVDYDMRRPQNQPDQSTSISGGTAWNVGRWNVDYWAGGMRLWNNWQGVAAIGRVGAPRLTADILNCSFAVSGFDVIYETGAVFG